MTTAVATASFLDSLGINTHIEYSTGPYSDRSTTIASINYVGVKNLRDNPHSSASLGSTGYWQAAANATGAKFCAYIGEGSPSLMAVDFANIMTLTAQGIIRFVDGPNEEDDAYPISQGNSIATAQAYQISDVWPTAHGAGFPVLMMSFGAGWTATNGFKGDYDKVGDMSAYCDYANAHTYPNPANGTTAAQHVDSTITRVNGLANIAAPGKPVITSEIGWQTTATTWTATQQACNVMLAAVDGWTSGNPFTFFYALYDDTSGHWGVMNNDGTPKLAGTALHNLTSLLTDAGTPLADSLSFTLSGTTANDHSLLLEKSTGTFYLALWNERDASHAVTVTLPSAASAINQYDPVTSGSPIVTATGVASVSVTLPGDRPIWLEIIPCALQSVSDSPTSVVGGAGGSTGVVTMTAAAPSGGAVVALSSNNAVVTVPASVTVPGGSTSASFAIGTTATTSTVNATLTATYLGVNFTCTMQALGWQPQWTTIPGAQVVTMPSTLSIPAAVITDPKAVGHAGTCALTLTGTKGTVSVTGAGTATITGNGTTSVSVHGSITDIDTVLGTLVFTPTATGAGKVHYSFFDQGGVSASADVNITIS